MTKCHFCQLDCSFTLMGYIQKSSNIYEPKSICPECLYVLGKSRLTMVKK